MTDHPLIAFLRARLDEDERTARDGEDACWHVDYCDDVGQPFHERFAPERVLGDIAAKRRMLDWLERINEWANDTNLWDYDEVEPLKILALPYADHPDYREEWKP